MSFLVRQAISVGHSWFSGLLQRACVLMLESVYGGRSS